MGEAKLGRLADADAGRDAVHVAVVPVVAPRDLAPGQHVGPDGDAGGYHVGVVDPFLAAPVRAGELFYLCLYPGTVAGMRHHWSHPAFPDATPGAPPAPAAPAAPGPPASAWRTDRVRALCRSFRTGGTAVLPILADALEDEGYPDAPVLARLRAAPRVSWAESHRLVSLVESDESAAAVRWVEWFAGEMAQTFERLMDAADTFDRDAEYTYDNSERYKDVAPDLWPVFWGHYRTVTGAEPGRDADAVPFTCSC